MHLRLRISSWESEHPQPYIQIVAHKLWPITDGCSETIVMARTSTCRPSLPIDIGDHKSLNTNSVRQWPVSEFGGWLLGSVRRWISISGSESRKRSRKGDCSHPSRCSLNVTGMLADCIELHRQVAIVIADRMRVINYDLLALNREFFSVTCSNLQRSLQRSLQHRVLHERSKDGESLYTQRLSLWKSSRSCESSRFERFE